jgi:hypothetical protein
MTGINCDLFTHKQSRSYLNYLVLLIFNAFYSVDEFLKSRVPLDLKGDDWLIVFYIVMVCLLFVQICLDIY